MHSAPVLVVDSATGEERLTETLSERASLIAAILAAGHPLRTHRVSEAEAAAEPVPLQRRRWALRTATG